MTHPLNPSEERAGQPDLPFEAPLGGPIQITKVPFQAGLQPGHPDRIKITNAGADALIEGSSPLRPMVKLAARLDLDIRFYADELIEDAIDEADERRQLQDVHDSGDNPDYPIDWSEQDRMAAESERLADHPFSGNRGEY